MLNLPQPVPVDQKHLNSPFIALDGLNPVSPFTASNLKPLKAKSIAYEAMDRE
jgi:hypothetical protein